MDPADIDNQFSVVSSKPYFPLRPKIKAEYLFANQSSGYEE
jgi:hypothetical protein